MSSPGTVTISSYPTPAEFYAGTTVQLTARVPNHALPLSFQWIDANGPIAGATKRNYTTQIPALPSILRRCQVSNTDGTNTGTVFLFNAGVPMPSTTAVGDIIRIQTICALGAQRGFNSFFFKVTAAGTPPATDQDFTTAFDNNMAANYRAWLPPQATYLGVVGQILTPVLYPSVFDVGSQGAGLATLGPVPGQVSGLWRKITARGGRAGRGRMFVPFPSDDWRVLATGAVNAAGQLLLDAIGAAAIGPYNFAGGGRTGTMVGVLTHKDGSTPDALTGYLTIQSFATHKSRGLLAKSEASPLG